jgi:Zn-dependent membrane protease YugP
MTLLIPVALLFLLLILAPRLWIARVLRRHATPRHDISWTGAEFARHLLDGMKLTSVTVEETEAGDHYDPLAKAVRLTPDNFRNRSLTAIVVAAHEVGHAMQDATGYVPLQTRTRIARAAGIIHKVGAVLILGAPLLALALRHPAAALIGFGAAVLVNLTAVVMHVVTLPVEFDASFNRALLLLKEGGFVPDHDLGAARHILSAAAYTYVAAALVDLINVSRLLRGLRF